MRREGTKPSRNFQDATGEKNRYDLLNQFLSRLGVITQSPDWGTSGNDFYNTDLADPTDPYSLEDSEKQFFGFKPGPNGRDEYLNALYRKAQTRLIQAVGK